MYELLVDDVKRLLPALQRRMRLSLGDAEEVAQEALIRMWGRLDGDAELAQRLSRETPKRRAYVWRTLERAAKTLFRRRRNHEALLSDPPANEPANDSRLGLEDAQRLLRRVWKECGAKGRMVMETYRRGISAHDYADERGVSRRTVARHFAAGISIVRNAVDRALAHEFGLEARSEFTEALLILNRSWECIGCVPEEEEANMCSQLGKEAHEVLKKYKLRKGELAYRQLLGDLPDAAQRIVFVFEANGSAQDAVTDLSYKYHSGKGDLSPEELRAGMIEFMELVSEIRRRCDV